MCSTSGVSGHHSSLYQFSSSTSMFPVELTNSAAGRMDFILAAAAMAKKTTDSSASCRRRGRAHQSVRPSALPGDERMKRKELDAADDFDTSFDENDDVDDEEDNYDNGAAMSANDDDTRSTGSRTSSVGSVDVTSSSPLPSATAAPVSAMIGSAGTGYASRGGDVIAAVVAKASSALRPVIASS